MLIAPAAGLAYKASLVHIGIIRGLTIVKANLLIKIGRT